MPSPVRKIDRDALRQQFRGAKPFGFFVIDNFLEPEFARAVVEAYPGYEQARAMGREFVAVNEKLKVQVTDSAHFPTSVCQLADALSSPEFLGEMEYITGIPNLVADAAYEGGGMHLSNTSGRLDVHVDFNFNNRNGMFRRLNILVYLNPVWEEAWGGNIELWDEGVTRCLQSYSPVFNRCLVFETNDVSYHGVTPIKCPPDHARKSFAAYYYTREAPANWDGQKHSTIFRARPDEQFRGKVLMPAEGIMRSVSSGVQHVKGLVKRMIGR
jgi:hypothetical protein